MKLSKWCKKKGISYSTGLRWYHSGKIKNAYQMDSLTIIVDEAPEFTETPESNYIKKVSIFSFVHILQ